MRDLLIFLVRTMFGKKKPVDLLEEYETQVEGVSSFIQDLKTKAINDLNEAQRLREEIDEREKRYSKINKNLEGTIKSLEKFVEILG